MKTNEDEIRTMDLEKKQLPGVTCLGLGMLVRITCLFEKNISFVFPCDKHFSFAFPCDEL